MPRQRIPLLQPGRLHRGLWLVGPREAMPEGALRRAVALHPTHEGAFKPRLGGSSDTSIAAAHSLYQFNGIRFQGATTVLYRNGSSLITGLDGTRLTFTPAPPGAGQADSLFVCGGGSVDKVDTSGTVSEWGIAAPPDGFAAAASAILTRTIEDFEGDNTSDYTGTSVTIGNEATILKEGARSMSLTVAASTIGTATQSTTVDLSTFAGPVTSPDEDWIRLRFRVDEPDFLDYIEITFSLGNTSFATDTYSRRIVVEGIPSPTDRQGVTAIQGFYDDQEQISGETTVLPTPAERVQALNQINQTFIPRERGTWVTLEIPKSTFKRSGDSTVDWSDVQAHRFTVAANSGGQVVCYFDLFELAGGYGLQGRYRYHVTYRNTTTGHRSNANDTYVEVSNVGRQAVALTSLPTSSDTQVDQREIWRTVGGGSLFFRCGTVDDNVTTTFTDQVADFAGLDTSSGATVLESTQLPTDNGKPPDTIDDALWDGKAMFWLDSASGQRGRVRYSPLGRPEADKGFIEISSDDEPLQRLVLFNGIKFVVSDAYVYRIDGTDPYTSRRVFGVPGVEATHKHTLAVTPYGMIWQAADGVRVFDGVKSRVVSDLQLEPVFDGQSVENLTPFAGVIAGYGRDEYLISDGTQALGYHLTKGRWRDLGVGFTGLYYEPDGDVMTIGTSDDVEIIETPGTAYTGDFILQSADVDLSEFEGAIVERLFIDMDPDGLNVTPTLLLDGAELTLPVLTGASRDDSIEYVIGRAPNRVGIRLTMAPTADTPIVYGVSIDVYIPTKS